MSDPSSLSKLGLVKRLTQAVSYELSGGWFTPENPLVPTHPETAGRRYDYLAGFNISTRPRRDSGVSFEQLRNLANYYDLLRIIIEKRKDQISNFGWSVAPVQDPDEKGKKPSKAVQDRIDYATRFLQTPDGRLSWSRWLRQIVEDYLVLDAIALWPVYKGKECQRIEVVDPATIKMVIDESGRRPEPPFPAYQQILHGTVTSNYLKDELRYFISNPRSNSLYGYSKVEQIIVTIQMGLRREMSQLQYFTEGNIPDAIVGTPENWTPQQIGMLQVAFDAMLAGNTGERRRLKFVPGDASKIQMMRTEEGNLKTEFDEWLIRIVCFAFGVTPTPFTKQVNRATAESASEEAREEGLGPSLAYVKDIIDTIIHSVLKLDGIEFKWATEMDVDPGVQADIDDKYIKNGTWSVDDVRTRQGMPTLGVENMVYLPTGPVPLQMLKDGTAPNLQQKPAPGTSPGTPGGTPPKAGPPGAAGGGKPLSPQAKDAADNAAAEGADTASKISKGVSARSAPPFRLRYRKLYRY